MKPRGFSSLIVLLVVALVITGGAYFYISHQSPQATVVGSVATATTSPKSVTNQTAAMNPLSQIQVEAMFQGSRNDQKKATIYVTQHPDVIPPIEYAYVINNLWQEGNKTQATFWFYIFQSRTNAWAKADTNGDGVAALRASLNDGIGQTINSWAGSDLNAWHDIAQRAISYEKKIPLYSGRPDGISDADWQKSVVAERTQYEDGFTQAFSSMLADKQSYDSQRASNGLYVGPLQSPGEPLLSEWK